MILGLTDSSYNQNLIRLNADEITMMNGIVYYQIELFYVIG